MEDQGLPILRGPIDRLRQDTVSFEQENSKQHPAFAIQKSGEREWHAKLNDVRKMYGSHMAMRLETERQFYSRSRRLPGLESSKIALQTLMGNDDKIDFSDFLDDPQYRPTLPKLEVHGQMEIKLGLI